jgi:glutathione S-transferase
MTMTSADLLPAAVLKRKAVVYVRQSTQAQVHSNLEGQRRQYELVDVARRRGFRDVEVIDDDLGRSASGMVARPGFERLVAWLCAGEVGAVLCFDASRLARNGRDWHHLLELCGLVEARVIDLDGVYDPCRPNDRLVTESGTLTETPGLLLFVAQRFPDADLAPLEDPFALAQLQEFNSYLCSTVHVAHAHGRRGARWADDTAAIEAMKRKVPATMTECFELIEHKLLKGPWVTGEQYTICDPYLFTIGSWIEGDGVDTTKLPRVIEHRRRMLARPAVQKAIAAEGTQIP